MTAARLISIPVHGALELLAGVALMGLPFALGAEPAGAIAAVVAGTIMVGLALGKTADGTTINVALQHSYDWGLALGLLGGALVAGVADQPMAALLLAAAALTQLVLNLITRYSPG